MHNSISGTEAADRLAIRQLIEAYAHCADRRDAKKQMPLFTPDTHFIVYMDAKSSQPAMDFHRREDLAAVFADLNKYEATTHFGYFTKLKLCAPAATENPAPAACGTHHIFLTHGRRFVIILCPR